MVTNLVGAHSRAPRLNITTRRLGRVGARLCAPTTALRRRPTDRRRNAVDPSREFVLLSAIRVFSVRLPTERIRLDVFVNARCGVFVADDMFPIPTLPDGHPRGITKSIDLNR